MSKRAIFLASTATGLALFSAIGFMQMNSGAFTSTPRVDLDSYLYSEVPVKQVQQAPVATPPAAEPGVLMLPPIEVFSRPTRTHPAPTQPAVHETTVPCSPWREIGPRHVDEGKPSGSLQVRDLC